MTGEETLLDAPVTPAPLFAYRALRGVFFGTPESPVVSFQKSHPQADKENIPVETGSPSKSQLLRNSPVRLTPLQKRKRSGEQISILSPTKSCLRTPGVQTPRREMLRDVNVTFRESLIKRLSPEFVEKNALLAVQSEEIKNGKILTSHTGQPQSKRAATTTTRKANDATLVHLEPIKSVEAKLPQTQQKAVDSNFDIEVYTETTEKEMKKLIRYGQKMREYARKQDEENTKLKQLVEELQRENQRLRSNVDVPTDEKIHKEAKLNFVSQASRSSRKVSTDAAAVSNQKIRPVTSTRQTGQSAIVNKPKLGSSHSLSVHPRDQIGSNFAEPYIFGSAGTMQHSAQNKPQFESKSNQGSQSSTTAKITTAITASISANLAPDRLAAARARIRQRSEMRKASSSTVPTEAEAIEEDNSPGRAKALASTATSKAIQRALHISNPGQTIQQQQREVSKSSNRESEKDAEHNASDRVGGDGGGAGGSSMLDWADLDI